MVKVVKVEKIKTYKREVAIALLVLLYWPLVVICSLKMGEERLQAFAPYFTIITIAVFGYVGAAFGLDAMAKQIRPKVVK